MTDNSVSRRLFLSAVAAAPAAPVLLASDRIAIFDPPPERVRIVAARPHRGPARRLHAGGDSTNPVRRARTVEIIRRPTSRN